ncbi:MAG: methyl-accepting chemotaxis protein [Myxococcaceae bacterium]
MSPSVERAAAAYGGDAASLSFLSVAFHVPSRAQGAVHLAVSAARATDDEAANFARSLEDAARADGLPLRVVWCAPTRGPHAGERAGALVWAVDELEAPRELGHLHINQTLRAAQQLSETSVLAIGDELRDIQGLASSQVDGLRKVAQQLAEADESEGGSTVAGTFERLAGDMRTFGQEILERTQRQAAAVEQARGWTADIVKLGKAIGSIAGNARLLTFNTRLESARLGEAGRGFNVIATAIQELATQVRSTNEAVAQLADHLARALPRLGADALDTSKSTQAAVTRLESELQDLQGRLAAVGAESRDAVAGSSQLAEDLHQKTNNVIHHLQFQDRASQMLQDAASQVSSVLNAAGLVETPVAQQELDQVGVMGRTVERSAIIAPGAIELF